MAEGRMIKKRIAMSKKLADLADDSSRALYFMLYPHADVQGRLEADAELIRGQFLTYWKDWEVEKIDDCLLKLSEIGLIKLYNVNGNKYLELSRFKEMQRLDPSREAKSVIPSPDSSGANPEDSAISKVKLSKVKLIKDQPSAHLFTVNALEVNTETLERMNDMKSRGVNIFMLVNKFYKDSKLNVKIPEKVIIQVLDAFDYYKPKGKKYPYFMKVLKRACEEYCISLQKQAAKIGSITNQVGINRMKELIKGIGGIK